MEEAAARTAASRSPQTSALDFVAEILERLAELPAAASETLLDVALGALVRALVLQIPISRQRSGGLLDPTRHVLFLAFAFVSVHGWPPAVMAAGSVPVQTDAPRRGSDGPTPCSAESRMRTSICEDGSATPRRRSESWIRTFSWLMSAPGRCTIRAVQASSSKRRVDAPDSRNRTAGGGS